MKRSWIIEAIIAALLLLFSYAALSKMLDYDKFVFQMQLSPWHMLKTYAPVLGWLVPITELGIVALLLIPRLRVTGLYASLCLMIIFEGYITTMLLSGLDLPCTCGGLISRMSWPQHLIFNAFFILISLTAILLHQKIKRQGAFVSPFDKASPFSRA
ncbi:MauE/DoxX family redox-associated membrane protein [Compostibacter hankyongensis]|uniref:Methylamine utilisation protein MauE domain-containing protein n=1 Tax=Compostibacter hankyongensis TaxID=1007089 RepID=A0ABP8G4L2_9BACT